MIRHIPASPLMLSFSLALVERGSANSIAKNLSRVHPCVLSGVHSGARYCSYALFEISIAVLVSAFSFRRLYPSRIQLRSEQAQTFCSPRARPEQDLDFFPTCIG